MKTKHKPMSLEERFLRHRDEDMCLKALLEDFCRKCTVLSDELGLNCFPHIPDWGFYISSWQITSEGLRTEWCRSGDPYGCYDEDEWCSWYIPFKYLSSTNEDDIVEWLKEVFQQEQKQERTGKELELQQLAYDLIKNVVEG